MRIIKGLNYYYKLEEMIKECIKKASDNPFEQYVFICEDKHVVEHMFFNHTHYLVNISIMTWNQYLQSLQVRLHLTKHKIIDPVDYTYYLYTIFKHHHFSCFNADNPFPLIKDFKSLLKELELNETIYELDHKKLSDFMSIYHLLYSYLDEYTHLCIESFFDHISLNSIQDHLYVEADHLLETKRMNILTQFNDVTLLYTSIDDERLFNLPFINKRHTDIIDQPTFLTDHLFSLSNNKLHHEEEFYTFVSPNNHLEVNRVVYSILEKIADFKLHYKDFMIVYPDETYRLLLLNALNAKNIPHNIPIIKECIYENEYQMIINELKKPYQLSIKEYASIFLQKKLSHPYIQYFTSLLNKDEVLNNKEMTDFFTLTYTNNTKEVYAYDDYISIVPIEKVKTYEKKYIYFVGLNETVLPKTLKDTGLLLDEDINLLDQYHIPVPLNTINQRAIIENDILKALQTPAHMMCFSYSITSLSSAALLPSTLYKQLDELFILKNLDKNVYLPIDEFYLKGSRYNELKINDIIDHYKYSKNQPDDLDQEILNDLYSSHMSVSQIETYNKCPYLYFVQYGLGIYKDIDDSLRPNELGSLVHHVLEKSFKEDQSIDILVNQYLLDNEILSNKIKNSSINQYFIDQLKDDLVLTLQVLREMDQLSLFEMTSQEEKIVDDINGISFKGFVDRYDTYSDYCRIIDYKSSAKDIDLSLAMQGFNIQMLLYLKMMSKKHNKTPGAVLYFNTKKRILKSLSFLHVLNNDDLLKEYKYSGYVIDDDEYHVIEACDPTTIPVKYKKSDESYSGNLINEQQLNQLLSIIEEHIYELYQDIRNGIISITPKGSSDPTTHTKVNPCRYCDYHSVCQFDAFYNEFSEVKKFDASEILKGGENNGI